MEEGDDMSDYDSDETVVEGSVIESDRDEEELSMKRLSFVNKDISLTTESNFAGEMIRVNRENCSPEIQLVCKCNDYLKNMMQKNQINPLAYEMSETEQSQSLLQGAVISQSGLPLSAVVGKEQHYSVGLDTDMSGFLKTERKPIYDEDDSPERSLLSSAVVKETLMDPEEWTPQNVIPDVLKDGQSESMSVTETDKRVTDNSFEKSVPDIILSSILEKISREALTVQSITTEEFEVKDLLKPLSDSESSERTNPWHNMLQCQGDALSIVMPVDEESSILPVELLTALNSFSGSVVQPVCQLAGKERECTAREEHLSSELSAFQTDDYTQIPDNNFEPLLTVKQLEETRELTESAFQGTLDKQLVGDQRNQDLVISDYWNVASYDKQANEGNSCAIENGSSVEFTKATSCTLRKSAQLIENCSRKHIDEASNCHKMLEETHQRIYSNEDETGNEFSSKDSGTQESPCKDSREQHSELTVSTDQGSTMNVNNKVEQMRKSQRIAKKIKKQTSVKFFSNTVPLSIPRSKINRKNHFGETLLHKAVADDDTDLVCKIIKVGGNVNSQDYAGWTPLHEASVAGFYKTANELLKAGADVNCKGSERVTPIQDAVREGYYEVAELLLWYGADPLFKNKKGKCALDEANDQRMRKLLESYISKSNRGSTSAKKDLESTLNTQHINDTNQHQLEVQLDDPVQNSDVINKTSKQGYINFEKSSKENSVRNAKGSRILKYSEDGLWNEKKSEGTRLFPTQSKKSVGTVEKIIPIEHISEYRSNESSPDTPRYKTRSRSHKTHDPYVGHNNTAFTVNISSSKRISMSSVHHNCSSDNICEVGGKPSIPKQTEIQKQHDFCNNDDLVSEEMEKICGSNTPSTVITDQVTSLQCSESSVCVGKVSTEHSEHAELTELDSHSVVPLGEKIHEPFVTAEQCFLNQGNEWHHLNHKEDGSMSDKNLNTAKRVSSIHSVEENITYAEKNKLSDPLLYSENSRNEINFDIDKDRINEKEQKLKHWLSLSEDTSLQGTQLEAGSLTTLSPQGTVNLTDSDCTVLSEQYVENENQNIYKNISNDVNNSTAQTLQTSTKPVSLNEFSAAISRHSVSENAENFGISLLSPFAHQVDEGMRMVLNAEEPMGQCCTEKIEEELSSEINRSIALQQQTGALQVKRKRQDLQEITLNTDLCSTNYMNKNSLHLSQLTQERAQDMPQKSDRGMTAERSGEQSTGRCAEKIEEGTAKNNMPITLQLLEKETIQTKRIRQDLHEMNQKTDLCAINNNSSNLSQFCQAAEQEMSEKSEYSLSSNEEIVAVSAQPAHITRTGTKKRNAKGESRLHLAAVKGDLSLVKTLIASGICVNLKNNAGWTAIHEASNKGFTEVILELLKAGADVNSKSLDGTLPIHEAVSGNYFKAVTMLLKHGANPNEKDKYGKSALDEACSDRMKELLKSYGTTESDKTTEVTGPSRSRRSTRTCCDCFKKVDVPLVLHPGLTREKCGTHESIIATLQDIEQRQKKLLLFELRNPKDAGLYIRGLSQIQDTLNEVLAKQKAERDVLAKKYRASVESFKQGALREQLVKLASRQKSLLIVAQKQKELGQKIKNYKNAKQGYSISSKKQVPNSIISYEKNRRDDLTVDKIVHPDVVTVNMGPDAKLTNGNLVETHVPVESKFSNQYSQHSNSCLDEIEANEEGSTSKEASSHVLAYENRVREYTFDETLKSKSTDTIEMVTSPSEPINCISHTKCFQREKTTYIVTAVQGSKSANPTPVTSTLSISEAESFVINNNIHQPTADCQQDLTTKTLQRYGDKNETSQKQPTVLSESGDIPITLHKNLFQNNRPSCNATGLVSDVPYPVNISQNSSSQYSDNLNSEQQQSHCGGNRRKNNRLKELLELGRIKPGENVLEFRLQDFSHKATLLGDGKIRTSDSRIHGNPVRWVKALLGNGISVSWKYVWNKVTYLGTELSKIHLEEACIPHEPELSSQQKPSELSLHPDSTEDPISILQLNEIVLINTEEFLPCHMMDQYWKFYVECENFGF